MDHLFDCVFRCEDRYARWLSVNLGKTILVAPELAGFSHSQGHGQKIWRAHTKSALPLYPDVRWPSLHFAFVATGGCRAAALAKDRLLG